MEKYINDNTIIKNDTFESFSELIYCQICFCLMIDPVMCFKCQNNYCKNCIESWKEKSDICPNQCKNPIFINVIEKNRVITKMKFKCIKGCGAEILFDDIKYHYSSNCLENIKQKDKKKEKDKNKSRKIKLLTTEEVAKLKRKNKYIELEHFNSK